MSGFLFLVGLIIVSIALGGHFGAVVGFTILGSGVMLLGIIYGILDYLDGKKG